MSFDRRRFLQTAGAAAGSLVLPAGNLLAAPARQELVAGVFNHGIRASGAATAVWGFNGKLPGPVLRYKQGDAVDVHVRNDLPQPTTVHWHGLRVPNAMDGVPNVTQKAIEKGATFDYRFQAVDAGTYWYHPHQSSFEQVPRGLYGAFIVEEAKPLAVDREEVWILSDFKLDDANAQVEDFGRIRHFATDGRLGNVVTLNGTPVGEHRNLTLRPGERVRLRLCNASSARAFLLEFQGHKPWIVSHDGQPVPPQPIPDGRLLLGAGQRTDLVIDGTAPGSEAFAIHDHRQSGGRVATIRYAGKPVRAKALGRPAAIAPNRLVEPNVARATDHYLVFQGGMKGAPAIARVDGRSLQVDEIMDRHGLAWSMNYTAQHEHAMMHEPLFRLKKGEHVTLKMINETEYEHPMHLHGHFFRVLALNDVPSKQREWRDTVVLDPRGSCDIAFVADNPGEWMFHCHILDHAAGGMMGTIVVEG